MKVVLTIAGSDSSGGAGIQSDLKTFEAFGVFGTSVITALTAQNTTGVQAIHPIPADFIAAQIESVLSDFKIKAIKIGMLYSTEIIRMIQKIIAPLDIPIVLDPVCISKVGSILLEEDAIKALQELSRDVTLTTPNLHEAYRLFGYKIGETDSLCAIIDHPSHILIKNHIINTTSADLLYFGHQKRIFTSELIDSTSLHGTGCSYSSAITANLALGYTLEESIERSKRFISEAIRSAPSIGHGRGPINHKAGGKYIA
ncbi:MAG: bifunctional hydroxymethylpyrimidine kinase/phosphomethylpyrimidine kinase [Sulfuricurvum sp.]|uniref:bifunctional hydroxymethylpyrimidine kinase/phosphomethylpyrimidine kinase n=1 Tax=Sulfuricurvum sp. TaxID=2025608 RepID=UPI0025F9759E|nr:bifunctional hydroxymethylpyrimidine kinase/phosphomethylpyrimidine kinase [Sulfuricurvum sp.]MBV5320639.1 bifunctional hydroxymethylpyrimidine kinase/phosphomethylpyrimidine kinase [Sulfuricurvum sp.]